MVVGAAAWWWSWTHADYDALAGAVAAGHVIECGPQATGGNFSGFRTIADLVQPGFPIAEIAADGSSVITKNAGTGGAVTQDTVTAQLLYEIGDPAYLNPDVIAHLDTAELTDLGDDRVRISGVRGSAPPVTTKVAITGIGGWQNSVLLALTGANLDEKAALVEQSVDRYIGAVDGVDAVAVDRIGNARSDPESQNAGTELLRIAVQGTKEAAGRAFSSQMVELALSSYPGMYSLGPPQPGSAFGVYWPALLDQAMLQHRVHHFDGASGIVAPERAADGQAAREADTPLAQSVGAPCADELVLASLGDVVHARSGDKGGDANLGVWVRDRHAWEWLKSTLTVDELRILLPETRDLPIVRYELPKLGAVNFLIRGLLGTGATSSLRLDAQAKALGEWLLRAQHQGAEIFCSRGTSMSASDDSTVDVVRKATRELARKFDYAYWREKDKTGRIPVGVRQGVRRRRLAGSAHSRGVRRPGAGHRGVRRDDAGDRRLRCRREWRLRGALLPVPAGTDHSSRLRGDEAEVPPEARPRRDPHGVRRDRTHRRGGHLAHPHQGGEGLRWLAGQWPEGLDQQRTERSQDPAAGADVSSQRGETAGRDDALLHRLGPRPDHGP